MTRNEEPRNEEPSEQDLQTLECLIVDLMEIGAWVSLEGSGDPYSATYAGARIPPAPFSSHAKDPYSTTGVGGWIAGSASSSDKKYPYSITHTSKQKLSTAGPTSSSNLPNYSDTKHHTCLTAKALSHPTHAATTGLLQRYLLEMNTPYIHVNENVARDSLQRRE